MFPEDMIAIRDSCLCLAIKRAARAVARQYDDAFADLHLTSGQFSLLAMLAGQDEWTLGRLAASMSTDRTSLTAALKPLERRKLLQTGGDPKDGRLRMIRLMPAGRKILDSALPRWRSVQDVVLAKLAKDNTPKFLKILDQIS